MGKTAMEPIEKKTQMYSDWENKSRLLFGFFFLLLLCFLSLACWYHFVGCIDIWPQHNSSYFCRPLKVFQIRPPPSEFLYDPHLRIRGLHTTIPSPWASLASDERRVTGLKTATLNPFWILLLLTQIPPRRCCSHHIPNPRKEGWPSGYKYGSVDGLNHFNWAATSWSKSISLNGRDGPWEGANTPQDN